MVGAPSPLRGWDNRKGGGFLASAVCGSGICAEEENAAAVDGVEETTAARTAEGGG